MAGLSSMVTVHLPNMPCSMTTPTNAVASHGGLLQTTALAPRETGDNNDQQTERAGEIAMHHLLPGFGHRNRALRRCDVGLVDVLGGVVRRELAIAARPVRASQTGVRQTYVGTQHHDAQRNDSGEKSEFAEHVSLRAKP